MHSVVRWLMRRAPGSKSCALRRAAPAAHVHASKAGKHPTLSLQGTENAAIGPVASCSPADRALLG